MSKHSTTPGLIPAHTGLMAKLPRKPYGQRTAVFKLHMARLVRAASSGTVTVRGLAVPRKNSDDSIGSRIHEAAVLATVRQERPTAAHPVSERERRSGAWEDAVILLLTDSIPATALF